MTPAQNITRHFRGDWQGNQGAFPTPGHSKADRGMTVKDADGGDVVFHSHNGGDWREVKDECRRLGLLPDRLAPADYKSAGSTFYDYRDAAGTLAYRVERRGKHATPPFVQHGPDGAGGFRAGKGCMQGVQRLPYRLPELLAADPEAIVFVCEGEKDADRLARDGLVATTNSGGAGKFGPELVPHFAGRRVVVLADNDEPGREHARDVAGKLRGTAAAVATLDLPGLQPKGDVSDWLRASGAFNNTAADLMGLAETALAPTAPDTLALADLTLWSRISATPTPFIVPGFIPAGEVTLLTGAGGGNKSTFGQQLATCAAAGLPMLGLEVAQSGALYATAEDGDDRLHWMQEHICRAVGVGMAALAGKLHLASIRGRLNNELATFDHDGRMQVRDTFHLIRATLVATNARLLVLDNVAHLFAGNENDRGNVTAFVNLLYQLCRDLGVTVVLVAHKNKAGDSYSGSTAWLNAVRSQLVLERAEGHDPDARVLSVGKANYARPDQTLAFRWHDFALVRDEDLPADVRDELASVAAVYAADDAFLACLDKRNEEQRTVSHHDAAGNYAPRAFAKMPTARGVGMEALAEAMERLMDQGVIAADQRVHQRPNRSWATGIGRVDRVREAAQSGAQSAHISGAQSRTEPEGEGAQFTPPYTTYNGRGPSGSAAPDTERPTTGPRGEILAPGERPAPGWLS